MSAQPPATDTTADLDIAYNTKFVSPIQQFGQTSPGPAYAGWFVGLQSASALRADVVKGSGNAIFASSDQDVAIQVHSQGNTGLAVTTSSNYPSAAAIFAQGAEQTPGLRATAMSFHAIVATSQMDGIQATNGTGAGFDVGIAAPAGVRGSSTAGYGVVGLSGSGTAIHAECGGGNAGIPALHALNRGSGPAIQAGTKSGVGVVAVSDASDGVRGTNGTGCGFGISPGWGVGVRGDSNSGFGMVATTYWGIALHAENNTTGNATAVIINRAGGPSAAFTGDVNVTGKLTVTNDIILSGADCAEEFDIAPGTAAEPGTVMVLTDDGALAASAHAYDSRVAGILSGAGDFRPALTLDRRTGSAGPRAALALVGKVFCKVDATGGPICVGDLLTTSATPGHAMRASDAARAFGAVLGKALAPLADGIGMVPILVALQ